MVGSRTRSTGPLVPTSASGSANRDVGPPAPRRAEAGVREADEEPAGRRRTPTRAVGSDAAGALDGEAPWRGRGAGGAPDLKRWNGAGPPRGPGAAGRLAGHARRCRSRDRLDRPSARGRGRGSGRGEGQRAIGPAAPKPRLGAGFPGRSSLPEREAARICGLGRWPRVSSSCPGDFPGRHGDRLRDGDRGRLCHGLRLEAHLLGTRGSRSPRRPSLRTGAVVSSSPALPPRRGRGQGGFSTAPAADAASFFSLPGAGARRATEEQPAKASSSIGPGSAAGCCPFPGACGPAVLQLLHGRASRNLSIGGLCLAHTRFTRRSHPGSTLAAGCITPPAQKLRAAADTPALPLLAGFSRSGPPSPPGPGGSA